MDFSNLSLYKVIEAARVVAIVPRDGIVPGANNLIIGPMASCREFLGKYLEARLNGMEIKAAHAFALQGAKIVTDVKAFGLGGNDAPGR